jgi:hypothetical protein
MPHEIRDAREPEVYLRGPRVESSTGATVLQPRTYGCAKCGTPFTAYPPDDVHNMSSRESSSFLKNIKTSHVCSKCNEVTRLYWGRPVFYRDIAVGLHRIFTLILQILLRTKKGESQDDEDNHNMNQEYSDSAENIDDEIYEYISSNGGAIAVRKAAEDLRIPAEVIKEAIERMATEGRLKPQPALI